MIGRPVEPSRLDVDATGPKQRPHRVGAEDQVDPEAQVAAKGRRPVIPPAESAFRLLELAERVVETELEDAAERRSLGGRAVDLALPRGRVVHVPVLGRDVEIADDDEALVAIELARELRAKRLEPLKLVDVFLRLEALTVRHVEPIDPHAAHGRAEHAPLRVFESIELGNDILERLPREERDAVVGGLAVRDRPVAELGEHVGGELLVRELRLLKREHVGPMLVQPGDHVLEPDAQAIDVPSRDSHAAAVSTMPAWRSSASMSGSRPRNATNASSAGRLPPTARISRRNRSAVAASSTPVSSNAAKASAASTSAHL